MDEFTSALPSGEVAAFAKSSLGILWALDFAGMLDDELLEVLRVLMLQIGRHLDAKASLVCASME